MDNDAQPLMGVERSRRRKRTIWTVAIVAFACGVLAVTGVLVAQSLFRGGAASPREAVQNLAGALSSKNLAGMYAMVAPEERDALQRVDKGAVSRFEDLGIANAIKATSKGMGSTGGPLAGITVTIKGLHPRIAKLSADVATATIDTGAVRWAVDPNLTAGVVRAQLDALHITKKLKGSIAFADLGNGNGVTLMETKSGGRWYVSVLLSGLELARSGASRGHLPATHASGLASPHQAAEALVRAVPKISKDGLIALAPYLVDEEAQAAYLYGGSVPWLSDIVKSVDMSVEDATFTSGPQDADREIAFVRYLRFSSGLEDRDTVTVSSKCVTEGNKPKLCLNGSGYFGASRGNGALSLLSDHGKFALTTVRASNSWKVSLIDTVADHAIWWVDSLTREQWLETLGLEKSDTEVGTLVVGKKTTITFNSAGYSVMKLTVPINTRLQISDDTYGILYDAHERYVTELRPGYSSDDAVKAGSYKLVLVAGPRWADAFSDQGNKLHYSTDLKVSNFSVKRPTIDYDTAPKSSVISTNAEGVEAVFDVQVPDGNKVNLVLHVTDVGGSGLGNGLVALVDDDQEGVRVAAKAGAEVTIPLPADSDSHAIHVWLPASPDHGQIGFTLSFDPLPGAQQPSSFVGEPVNELVGFRAEYAH